MTRKEIITKLVGLGFTFNRAKQAFETVLAAINSELGSGKKVKIAGFGTFYVKNKLSRNGSNPRTHEKITISAKKYPAFKPSPELRSKVNK